MPGTFSQPRISDRDMHHGACVTHVPWCMPGSLTSGLLWNQWWKRSRHSRRMRNPRCYVSVRDPCSLLTQLNRVWPALIITPIIRCRIKSLIHFQISSHTLLGVWLLIHTGVKVNPILTYRLLLPFLFNKITILLKFHITLFLDTVSNGYFSFGFVHMKFRPKAQTTQNKTTQACVSQQGHYS